LINPKGTAASSGVSLELGSFICKTLWALYVSSAALKKQPLRKLISNYNKN
jgi:hypothetical protein